MKIGFSKVLWIEKGIDEKKCIEKKKAAEAEAVPAQAGTHQENRIAI